MMKKVTRLKMNHQSDNALENILIEYVVLISWGNE